MAALEFNPTEMTWEDFRREQQRLELNKWICRLQGEKESILKIEDNLKRVPEERK